ncbi:MAG: SGNH/GDSL hydrolase family protein [Chloroflexota bacterium]
MAVFLAVALPLLLLEVALRWFGPILPGNYDTGAYLVRNLELGHFHVPGFDGWIKSREFTTHVKISQLGLRDRRERYEKPVGTKRVVLIGDSFVEAVQVNAQDAVAEQIEAGLSAAGAAAEVINAGVAAYGTGQEMLLLEREGVRYGPDVVVVLFFVGNDVANNNYRLELEDSNLKLALKPYWTLERDGSLRMIPGPPPMPPGGVAQRVRDCCVLYNVFETGVMNKLGREYPRERLEAIGGLRFPVVGLYDTAPDDEWRRAWQISEALLRRIKAIAEAAGARLVVAGAPEWRALDDEVWRREMRSSARLTSGRLTPSAPTDVLGDIVGRLGVPYVDLLPPLRQAYAAGERDLYYEFDKHWTAAGHRVAATEIQRVLAPLLQAR